MRRRKRKRAVMVLLLLVGMKWFVLRIFLMFK